MNLPTELWHLIFNNHIDICLTYLFVNKEFHKIVKDYWNRIPETVIIQLYCSSPITRAKSSVRKNQDHTQEKYQCPNRNIWISAKQFEDKPYTIYPVTHKWQVHILKRTILLNKCFRIILANVNFPTPINLILSNKQKVIHMERNAGKKDYQFYYHL